MSCVGATQPHLTRIKKDTIVKRNTLENQPIGTKMKYFFALFVILLLIIPVIGFLDGIKYKKNDNEYLDTARWSDGK